MRPITLSSSLLRPYVCLSCRRGTSFLSIRRQYATSSQPESESESDIPDIYDVVCVGGGPAGLALLAALSMSRIGCKLIERKNQSNNCHMIGSSPITSKLKVGLIETQDLKKARNWKLESNNFSNRVSSLTPSSLKFLKQIGAWDHVDVDRVQNYQEMQVWDGQTGSKISFDWSNPSFPFSTTLAAGSSGELSSLPRTIATMTENANLVRALLKHIEASEEEENNVSIWSNTRLSSIENGRSYYPNGPDLSAWPILSLSPSGPAGTTSTAPSRIAARLLVGADGINSPVRSFAGISTSGWDYNRHGVVATLTLAEPGPSSEYRPPTTSASSLRTAYQRFLPSLGGPIALLPLPDNHATLVWSTTVQNAAYLKSLPPKAFIAAVNAAFRLSMVDLSYIMRLGTPTPGETTIGTTAHEDELSWRLQHTSLPAHIPPTVKGIQEGTLASFPLRFRHASTYISPRVALVGDAAHVVHPLAGQGLNLGLGDVASLSATIEYAVSHGMDVGDILSLERYSSERYLVNAKIGGACDLLHKLYNVPGYGPVAWGRSVALDAIDRLPFVKGFLMKQAEGG